MRKNRTVDWQKRDSARAKMRMMIKRLLRKHKYPPEGMDDAVQTVMTQCELWADRTDISNMNDQATTYIDYEAQQFSRGCDLVADTKK